MGNEVDSARADPYSSRCCCHLSDQSSHRTRTRCRTIPGRIHTHKFLRIWSGDWSDAYLSTLGYKSKRLHENEESRPIGTPCFAWATRLGPGH